LVQDHPAVRQIGERPQTLVPRNPVFWTLRIIEDSVAQNCASFVSKRNVSGQ
jgi:hypothetical protein